MLTLRCSVNAGTEAYVLRVGSGAVYVELHHHKPVRDVQLRAEEAE